MTTHFGHKAWGWGQRAAGFALILGAILLSVNSGWPQNDSISPARAREALRRGIDSHKRGDYESALQYLRIAKQGDASLSKAEKADLTAFSAQNGAALKSRAEGAAQVKRAADALQQGKTQEATTLLKGLDANQYLTDSDRKQMNELTGKLQKRAAAPAPPAGKADVKTLLNAGRSALQKGKLDEAEALAVQAEKANTGIGAWLQPWSDSPSKLRRDVQATRAKQQAAKSEPEAKNSSWLPSLPNWFTKSEKPAQAPAGNKEASDKAASDRRVDEMIARKVVQDGFVELQKNELGKAHFMAMKAKELCSTWSPSEPNPDQLLAEIQRRSGKSAPAATPAAPVAAKPAAAKPIEAPNTSDPRVLLRFARTLLEKKQFDEADKVCGKVLTMNARWGLWEDTPEKLRRDIQRGKMFAEREESFKVMAEARKLFAQGNLEDAERKAYQAQKMHGPFGVFDFGDRPTKLLDEIERAKLSRGNARQGAKPKLPAAAQQAPGKNAEAPTGVPATVQAGNRNRAIVMVREARDLERQGKWMEARQKATEARALKAPFTPEEDSPDAVLLSLSARCERQVQTMLEQVRDQVTNSIDPQRFDKASRQLLAARELAQAFELDMSRVNQTAAQVQQAAAGARPLNPAGNTAVATDLPRPNASPLNVPTGDPQMDRLHAIGREKLRDAQTELTRGNVTQARRMAEEIYDAKFGVQEEVRRLLNSIGNEEYNQRCLRAKRDFDQGVDAFVQRDYRRAQLVFNSIDMMMLPMQYQVRMREIMASRDMQPEAIVKTGFQQPLKGQPLNVTEPGGAAKTPSEPNLIEELKARETVMFQQLRQRSLEAQRTAHDLFKNKQRDQALATLTNFLDQVAEADFSPDKANMLRRPVENKIQQYKVLLAQEKWDKTEKDYIFPYGKVDPGKSIEERRKFQAKIVDMMTEAHDLFKQNKLKEAIDIAKKVRELDPENTSALAMERIATTRINQGLANDEINAKERFFLDALKANPGKALTIDDPIDFNRERIAARNKRFPGQGAIRSILQNPKEREIEYKLMQPLSLNFKNLPLQQAIREVAAQSGVQVVPDLGPLTRAGINLDAPLTVAVENIQMKSALNILLKPLNLSYVIEDEVLKITTQDNTIGRVVRVVYPVADLIALPEDHPLPDVFDIEQMIRRVITPGAGMPQFSPPPAYLYNAGTPTTPIASHANGLGTAFGTSPGGGASMPGPTSEKKHQMGEVLVQLIKNVIRKDSWSEFGGNGDVHYTPFGMALVVNQVQDVQKDVEELLASLRRLQDLQVSVELRAVLVSESFFERIGVDFNMNILTPDTPGKEALAAGSVALASANKTVTGYTAAGTLTPDLNIPVLNNTFALTQPQFGGYQPGAGLSLGLAFLSEIQVFMFLEAVAGDQRATVMQAPKLTVYNGQFAFITANVSRPFMSGVTPVLAPNGFPVMVPQMTVYPLGLGMTVQPVVSPDRRFVRLNITPILTSGFIDPAGQIIIPVPMVNQSGLPPVFINGGVQPPLPTTPLQVTNGMQFNPLVANVNAVNTTVNVPDGGTVLMGGFKFLAEQRSEYGPPVLSSIPYLSRLFRNVGWSRDSATLIYLVTARIIMVEEEEQIFLGNIEPIPRQ